MEQPNNNTPKAIGFVSSTLYSPANESFFSFILPMEKEQEKQVILNPLDIVKVSRTTLSNEKKDLYASVISVQAISDAPDHVANYVSSNFGEMEKMEVSKMRRLMFYSVSAKVMYSKSGTFFPVQTGDKVFLCEEKDVYEALYANYDKDEASYFPIAEIEMYKGSNKPLKLSAKLNTKYVLGPDSAHINISGMSGMASKTTKAMVILRQLFYSNKDCKIVIFNTKDADLMDIKHNKERALDGYQGLDKTMEKGNDQYLKWWDDSIKYLLPYTPKKKKDKDKYVFDLATQRKKHNLDLLVAMDSDESGTMDSCTKEMETSIVTKWEEFVSEVEKMSKTSGLSAPVISSWRKYLRVIKRVIQHDKEGIFTYSKQQDLDLSKKIESFLNDNIGERVLVVDLSPLDQLQQAVIFGCAIREIKRVCQGSNKTKVALFIDELNKYASVDTTVNSPILENLIDLAETGRSNGICLITAEQSLSVIHKRIKANFATTIYGKTSAVELTQFDYQLIPDSLKSQVGTFSHGDSLISTPTLNSGLLKASFPDKFYAEEKSANATPEKKGTKMH